jgi:hypothetical protein
MEYNGEGNMSPRDAFLAECLTNIDTSTLKGRAMLFNAVVPTTEDLNRDGELRLLVQYYVIYPDTVTNRETGEVSNVTRAVFIQKDGNAFRTTAPHAVNKFREPLALFTPREWKQGMLFVIIKRQSKDLSRTYDDIKIDLESL